MIGAREDPTPEEERCQPPPPLLRPQGVKQFLGSTRVTTAVDGRRMLLVMFAFLLLKLKAPE